VKRLRVAAFVPVYERARIVSEALDSIARQTRAPDELLVVDDGSADGSPEVVERWAAVRRPPFPVTLLRQPHRGSVAARNRALGELATADLLATLDSDDLWSPSHLERTEAALLRDPGAVAAHADVRILDVASGESSHFDQSRFDGWVTQPLFELVFALTRRDGPRLGVPPIPSSSVWRTAALRRAGGWDERLRVRADVDLHLRLSTLGRFRHVQGEPICYRRGVSRLHGGAPQITDGIDDLGQRLVSAWVVSRFLRSHRLRNRWWRARTLRRLTRRLKREAAELEARGRAADAVRCLALARQTLPPFSRRLARDVTAALARMDAAPNERELLRSIVGFDPLARGDLVALAPEDAARIPGRGVARSGAR
jgi:glycosyltransferase involved in cell wall biosynthesis